MALLLPNEDFPMDSPFRNLNEDLQYRGLNRDHLHRSQIL